jgi:2-phospho-L-lactate guanylyltransferase
MKVVLIPLKDSARAKTRLAELLSLDERQRLALAMFEDVSRAAARARQPDQVVLVTNFEPAIERAHELGWEVLIERAQSSESASVDWASRVLADRGVELVMRLPADVPLVQPADIDELLSVELECPAALLVPSRDGTGTNAIIRKPPATFASKFGPNSLALHIEEAGRAGVRCLVVENRRLALDLDEPSDLAAFLECASDTLTFALLSEIGIRERLGTGQRSAM